MFLPKILDNDHLTCAHVCSDVPVDNAKNHKVRAKISWNTITGNKDISLTSLTDASYMSVKSLLRGNSLTSNVTPAKLSWRVMYMPRSWKKK